ncbi:MAG TPA: inner membrane CreD family protein, partial [Myxococcota bacterium]|nr:inner membrane CreD family protein [Myxococcota bacterium]
MKFPLLKILLVCGTAVALAILVAMIQGLVAERQARSQEAVAGIAEGWGKRQRIANPYLAVPYERHWTEVTRETVDGKARERRTERMEPGVLRLPAETVAWSISADIGEKARGIYRARLYSSHLDARGRFSLPERAGLEDGTSRYKWGAPRLVVGISDPHGIRAAPAATIGGAAYEFKPGTADAPLVGGVH